MGIQGFWDVIDIRKKEGLSARDKVMLLLPLGRVRCLRALMAEVEATPPPDSLRHQVIESDKVDLLSKYRGLLEDVLQKLMLSVWRSCARQLFAAADPVRFIGEGGASGIDADEGGASGIDADAPVGLSAEVDDALLRTIDTLDLEKWPSWYMAQYDALVVQPQLNADVLNSDENQPARVWREGRAKAAPTGKKKRLYPRDILGQRYLKPKKTARKGIPVGLEPWIGGWQPAPGSELLYPPPCVGSAQGLPGVLAGNPELPETLPNLFVRYSRKIDVCVCALGSSD